MAPAGSVHGSLFLHGLASSTAEETKCHLMPQKQQLGGRLVPRSSQAQREQTAVNVAMLVGLSEVAQCAQP